MKLLFLLKKRADLSGPYSYSNYGLVGSTKFVINYLAQHNTEAKFFLAFDGNEIDKAVTLYKPQIAIIEALWCPPEKIAENVRLHPEIKWYIRIHSKLPFLGMEGIAVDWLYRCSKIPNVTIAANHPDTVVELSTLLNKHVKYLPNVFYPYKQRKIKDYSISRFNQTINIGCFGAIRPFKNTFVQAVAAIVFARRMGLNLRFHINDRAEQLGEQVRKNISFLFANNEAELVIHKWMDEDTFNTLLFEEIDISMQVSITETHNLVIAESINNGVLPVVSKEIYWLPEIFKTKTQDMFDIVTTMTEVWNRRFSLQSFVINAIHQNIHQNGKIWLKFISGDV